MCAPVNARSAFNFEGIKQADKLQFTNYPCKYSLTRTPVRSRTIRTFPLWVQGKSTPYAQPLWVLDELILDMWARMAASASAVWAFIAWVIEPITAVQVPDNA